MFKGLRFWILEVIMGLVLLALFGFVLPFSLFSQKLMIMV